MLMIMLVVMIIGVIDMFKWDFDNFVDKIYEFVKVKIEERNEKRREEICEKIKMDRWIDRCENLRKYRMEIMNLRYELDFIEDVDVIKEYNDRINYCVGMIKLYGESREDFKI